MCKKFHITLFEVKVYPFFYEENVSDTYLKQENLLI